MIIFHGLDGEPLDVLEWERLFLDTERRTIGNTELGDVRVSTVWLGMDWGFGETTAPLIFETMIFGGDHDGWGWRYPNREAALAGHDQAVALARDAALREIAANIKRDFGFDD